MSAPDLESFAAQLYSDLAPLAWSDEENDWALALLAGAIGEMFQEVETLATDTTEYPGWSSILDLERCPAGWLGWLAMFVGVTLLPNSTEAEQRDRIARTDGFNRGTPEAIRAAAQAELTGAKNVVFRERHGSAYQLQVITYTDQTPDYNKVLAAILAQKPAGIVLDYAVLDGQDYERLLDSVPYSYTQLLVDYGTYTSYALVNYSDTPALQANTYTALFARYPTYNDMRLGV